MLKTPVKHKVKDKSVLLIVDDEPYIQELLQEILSGTADLILCASDGAEAMEIIRKTEVDCILSDFQMPIKTGMQFLEEVTAAGILAPFVMLTAHTDQEKLLQALRLGALDFISKPFDSTQVLSVVTRALEIGRRKKAYQEKVDRLCAGELIPGVSFSFEHERKMMRLLQLVNAKR
jgi:DNA-binding NtrC family response regulator